MDLREKMVRRYFLLYLIQASPEERDAMCEPVGWRPQIPHDLPRQIRKASASSGSLCRPESLHDLHPSAVADLGRIRFSENQESKRKSPTDHQGFFCCAGILDRVNGGFENKLTCKGGEVDSDADKAWGYFFGQIREPEDTPAIRVPSPTSSAPLSSFIVWIRKDLVQKNSFSASDCFPISPDDDLSQPALQVCLRFPPWSSLPNLLFSQVAEVYNMLEKGRGRGKGRGGGNRGGPWQQQPPQQQMPPPPYGYGFQPQMIPPPQAGFGPFPPFQFPPQWQQYGGGYPQQIFPNQFSGPWQQPGMALVPWPQQQQQQAPQKQTGDKNNQQGKAQRQQSKDKEVINSAGIDGKSQDGGSVISTGSGSTTTRKADQYAEVICYNCGESGHHKTACLIPKSCFICGSLEHEVDACPVKKQPQQLAKFVGSAASGLGFYHIELPFQTNANPAPAHHNIALVYIDHGEVTKEELYQGLAKIYRTNWPWQIRMLDEWNYLVKFPPHLNVEEIAGYPSFGLPKEGVFVKVHVWSGVMDYYADLEEVWLQIRGLNQEWCKWPTLMQFVTAFGIMVDVDWYGMFKTFYEILRVKIKCRDHNRIPASIIFEVQGVLFQIRFAVEGPANVVNLEDNGTNLHPPHPDPDDNDDEQDLEEGNQKDNDVMDTGNQATTNAGQASAGGSRTNLGVPPADKQKNNSALSEKVQEVAQFYMNQRSGASPGPSKLSPIPEPVPANEKVLNWINQTTKIDKNCTNLLQDMELCHEDDVFYEGQEQEISQMELNSQAATVSLPNQLKKWGPIAGTRQSSRLAHTEGKTVMQLAQELAQKKTLEKVVPASSKVSGIPNSNPFDAISPYKFQDIANTVGIEISPIDNNIDTPVVVKQPVTYIPSVHLEGASYDDNFPDALDSSDDLAIDQKMEDHIQGPDASPRRPLLRACIEGTNGKLQNHGWLSEGSPRRGSCPSPPSAKKKALPRTWTTPTSTLEASTCISPEFTGA
ncbi:hypothetical protein ACQ4PT_006289 [Festuca glaucescens]